MQKLGISLLLFALSFATVSYAQSNGLTNVPGDLRLFGSFSEHSVTLPADTVFENWNFSQKQRRDLGQKLDSLRSMLPHELPSRHYFAQNGKEYYMNIVPAHKGTRVDDSNVWLLQTK